MLSERKRASIDAYLAEQVLSTGSNIDRKLFLKERLAKKVRGQLAQGSEEVELRLNGILRQDPTHLFMQEISPDIFLSGLHGAKDFETLHRKGITHVLAVMRLPSKFTRSFYDKERFTREFQYKLLEVDDVETTNLIDSFPELVSFIKGALLEGGRVLVHCAAGMSRSVTTVCAYLVAEEGLRWKEALWLCAQARPVICPNPGFKRQLAQWERQQRDARAPF